MRGVIAGLCLGWYRPYFWMLALSSSMLNAENLEFKLQLGFGFFDG